MIDKKKLAGIVLAGILTVAGTTSAFAADVKADTRAPLQSQLFKIDKAEVTAKMKSAIDSLVTAGTITQTQADAVLKCFKPLHGRLGLDDKLTRQNPISELVTAGTLTQTQCDEIVSAIKTGLSDKKTVDEVLKELVTVGKITEAQKDAIQKAFPVKSGKFIDKDRINKHGVKRGPFMKLGKNPIDELVSAGTITQAQADAINEAIKASLKPSDNQ